MNNNIIISKELNPSEEIMNSLNDFFKEFDPFEIIMGNKLFLYYDKKSDAYYVKCNLKASDIINKTDFEASLDGTTEDELYKLNREITENEGAFEIMVTDAILGRSFEDIVVEYDTSYNIETPLKIYGGQHRIKAIQKASAEQPDIFHGFRIYIELTKDQKVEIATVNNTSIVVSNDLLDRMREQMIGSELRNFCQTIGLLSAGQDFADKRDPIILTVRIARTLIVNYINGLKAIKEDFPQPMVCKSGGLDNTYMTIRKDIKWDDPHLIEMGKNYSKLHKVQREKVNSRKKNNYGEFARKAISLAVVSGWAYAAGRYQKQPNKLKALYDLPDNVAESDDDPLNAKALSDARLKGVDPDTYRGLGTRSNTGELGRMLELFTVLIEKERKTISLRLANAAIQSYEAKKSAYAAQQVLDKI